jgi:hypothetical protein
MTLFPKLLAILATILPLGNVETFAPIVSGSQAARASEVCFPVLCCPHLPCHAESLFECLEETAFDEEDSSRVEDHGIAPLTLLDYEASLVDDLLSTFFPAGPPTHRFIIPSILRC